MGSIFKPEIFLLLFFQVGLQGGLFTQLCHQTGLHAVYKLFAKNITNEQAKNSDAKQRKMY